MHAQNEGPFSPSIFPTTYCLPVPAASFFLSLKMSSESRVKDLNIYGKQAIAIAGSPLKSPSSLARRPILQTTSTSTSRSIDDVWNDISLSSLHHRTAAATDTTNPFHDFFSPSSTTNPCPGHFPPVHNHTTSGRAAGKVISVNQVPEPITNYLYKSSVSTSQSCNCAEPNFVSSSKPPPPNFIALPSSSSSNSSLPMKRPDPEYCEKHKRLMKNRESAARSRARKQARADELDLEVERLTVENAMLKKQLQQLQKLSNAAAPARVPKRCRLNRALTSPF